MDDSDESKGVITITQIPLKCIKSNNIYEINLNLKKSVIIITFSDSYE